MPTVKGGNARSNGQSKHSGSHSKEQIKQTMAPEFARDDLKGAFAGKENEKSIGEKHSTNLKSRITRASKSKTPKN